MRFIIPFVLLMTAAIGMVLAQEPASPKAPDAPPAPPTNKETPASGVSEKGAEPGVQPIKRDPVPVKVKQDTGVVRFDDGVTVFLDDKDPRVEVDGELLGGQSRPLEFLIVTSAGACHEALIRMFGKAYDLRQGLELLGLKEGLPKLAGRGDPNQPIGPKVDIALRWKNETGKEQTCPIEDWVFDTRQNKPMERGPWIFSGSVTQFREDLNRETFLADLLGNVVATWHDPTCVIDNPRVGGVDPMTYRVHVENELLPAEQSPVTLVIRKHAEKK